MNDRKVTLEAEIASVLNQRTLEDHVPVVQEHIPGPVERFLSTFSNVQGSTARECLDLAEWMERQAAMLKNAAATLNHQGTQIPDDVKHATSYEINVRNRVQFLKALQNIPKEE